MKLPITRALMTVLAVVWAVSAGAGTKEDDDSDEEMRIDVSPACIVVGAPVEYVTVNTNIPFVDAQDAIITLLVDDDPDQAVLLDSVEMDRQGELVARFLFDDVEIYVKGDYSWLKLILELPGETISDDDLVKVHDFRPMD